MFAMKVIHTNIIMSVVEQLIICNLFLRISKERIN